VVDFEPSSIEAEELHHDLVVLGAGFSKAVFDAFPLTDDLGNLVRERLSPDDQARFPSLVFADGRFEEWLSYLAEDQPHLAEDKALEAKALLYRVVAAIRDVLSEVQCQALEDLAPPWFYELLSVLHAVHATVITLNYDNLLECGIADPRLPLARAGSSAAVEEDDLLGGLPPAADFPNARQGITHGATYDGSPIADWRRRALSFRLLKLHGSLSWFWVPGDVTGMTLQRWLLPGTFGSPQAPDIEAWRTVLPGREPFIVPPASLKSAHLSSPMVRELWRRAHDSLTRATRLILVGYSLPSADTSFSGMVAETLKDRDVAIEVVNKDPGPVLARLARLGIQARALPSITGDTSIPTWAARERDRLSSGVMERLRTAGILTGEELLYVELEQTKGVVNLVPPAADRSISIEPNPPGPVSQPLRTMALLQHLSGADRIVVANGSRSLPIIDFQITRQPNVGSLDQLSLIPAGRP
jgi:hypothetical protein